MGENMWLTVTLIVDLKIHVFDAFWAIRSYVKKDKEMRKKKYQYEVRKHTLTHKRLCILCTIITKEIS